ncbi:MAG: sigma-70 family RNA polymerase sigma factor [Hydrogenoanaerobacterium sp.]
MTNEEFTQLVTRYEKLVFTICYQMVRDYGEAENLTQEAFFSAYKSIDSCRPESYKPWLARIAANKARDYLKSAFVRHNVISTDEWFDAIETGKPPGEIYEAIESEQYIKEKVHLLKEPYCKVSKLYFLEEKNIDEISALLKRPKKTIQTQIYRAKFLLKKMLSEEDTA